MKTITNQRMMRREHASAKQTTLKNSHLFKKINIWSIVFFFSVHLAMGQQADNDAEVAGFTALNSTNPAGTIIAIAGESKPVGYLFCDGRSVSKTTYPDLWAAIKYTYGGSGDNFSLPDLRGMFLRGWSSTSGNDPDKDSRGGGNTIGSLQNDGFKSHNHTMDTAGNHRHFITGLARRGGSNAGTTGSGVNEAVSFDTYSNYEGVHTHEIENNGGQETRPENIAVAYYIKTTNNESFEGHVGIGTTNPAEKLDVSGIGIFRNSADNYLKLGHGGSHSFLDHYGAGNLDFRYEGTNHMRLTQQGNLGIGTTNPTHKLYVNGDAFANTFVTSAASFPDYVFEEGYELMPLPEMEAYVKANHHLPNMPSEREVVAEGMNLNEVMTSTVENVETIYLHLIELKKELTELKRENRELKTLLSEKQ